MISSLVLALSLSSDAEPAVLRGPVPVVLVLTSGKGMRVKSYSIEGRMAKITSIDGEAMILRAADVDLERTEAATASAIARATEEQTAADEAAVQAEQDAADRAERRAKAKARPRRAGSMSVADGSAAKEVEAVVRVAEAPAPQSVGGGDNMASRRSELDQEIARLEGRIAELRKDRKGAEENLQRAGDLSTAAVFIRGQLQNIDRDLKPLEADLKVARDARGKIK